MPREVDIEIFKIAQTKVNRDEVQRWLDHLGAEGYELPDDGDISDPALLVALAAKRCYMSFEPGLNPNVTKVRTDLYDYIGNILNSRHGSVLEHAVYTFAIEGVSRVFTAEMNRHRAGWAISEGSLRFIRFDEEIPFWMPESLWDHSDDDETMVLRKRYTRKMFYDAFRHQEEIYGKLLSVWDMDSTEKNFAYKKRVTSCLRRIVGMGVATGGVWTGNLRALRHVIGMRADPSAEEEIFYVFSRIARIMFYDEPLVFQDLSFTERERGGGVTFRNQKV
jgi:thymidylate synthase (FAD)